MADAAARAELEATQVDLRSLKAQLEQWPEVGIERAQVTAALPGLEVTVQSLEAQLLRLKGHEAEARDAIDRRYPGGKWWRSPAITGAVVVAVISSFVLATKALDWFNWTTWAPRFAVPLLVVAPLVNAVRALRVLKRKLSRR